MTTDHTTRPRRPRRPHHPRRRIARAGALTLAGTLAGAALTTGAPGRAATDDERHPAPPGDTVVRVDGDAENGFAIHHYDGTSLHPPTLSETIAECGEYDGPEQALACEVEARTWFRDLAVLQQALRYAGAPLRR